MVWKRLVFIILAVVVGLGVLIWLWLPKFAVVNNLGDRKFDLSSVWGDVFLYKNGYNKKIQQVKVIYTQDVPSAYRQVDDDNTTIKDMGFVLKDKLLTLYIYYNPINYDQFNKENKDYFSRDIYIYICYALSDQPADVTKCNQQANDYLAWSGKYHLGNVTRPEGSRSLLFDWSLVTPAEAYCKGTIHCGATVFTPHCSDSSYTCNTCGGSCGPFGIYSCSCSTSCNNSGGPTLNCSGISSKSTCQSTTPSSCNVGCSNADVNCTWCTVTSSACEGNGCGLGKRWVCDSCGGCSCQSDSSCPICTCNGWNSTGVCGNTTNNCGYETMRDTRSCSPNGCASESRCSTNLACAWPGSVTGQKVLVSGSGNVGGEVVTMDALTSSANPYSFNIADTDPGVTHAVSVPALAGYDIGYSLCYNSTACHTNANIVGGTAVTVTEDGIRNQGNDFANPYASLYWHYCPLISEPTNLGPINMACVPSGSSASINLTWSPPVSGTAYQYGVTLFDSTAGANVFGGIRTSGTSYPATITLNHDYIMRVRAFNACGGQSILVSQNFTAVGPPTGSGILTGVDMGGAIQANWTQTTDGTAFRIYRDSSLINSVGPLVKTYFDNICGTHSYHVDAYDSTKPAGCQVRVGTPANLVCDPNNSSWFSASGGGNLVAASGTMKSQVPSSVYNPFLTYPAEGAFPGLAIASAFQNITSANVNTQQWWFNNTPGWGGAGGNVVAERENSYDGMHDRVWSRILPNEIPISTTTLDQGTFNSANSGGVPLGTSGVKIIHWWNGTDDTGTLNIGTLDLSLGQKAVIFVQGNVNLNGPITWIPSNAGFLTIIAKGNIRVDPTIGTAGSTMDVDVRPWDVPASLMGIYYAGGTFTTPAIGGGLKDKILKIDGTVVGMTGVSLQRNNVGRYPVEFFNFQPGFVEQLSQVGLRRKIVRELLNP